MFPKYYIEANLTSLPSPVLEKILLNLNYEEISQLRVVSNQFNLTCKALLNQGFRAAERFQSKCLKEVKNKLPRRESERRGHKLARHCDILTAIETRISLLSMTFLKYVDMDLCCFIPGKVVDEILSVLRCIQGDEAPPRAFEILQELRDLSSMAMEHFDEKIAPAFSRLLPTSPIKFGSTGFSLNLQYQGSCPTTPARQRLGCDGGPQSEPPRPACSRSLGGGTDKKTRSCQKMSSDTRKVVNCLKKKANIYKVTVDAQNKKMIEMNQRIDNQDEVIHQQNSRMSQQEEKLAEMGRRLAAINGGGTKRTAENLKDERKVKKEKFGIPH